METRRTIAAGVVGLALTAILACNAEAPTAGPEASTLIACSRSVVLEDIVSPVQHGTGGYHAHFTIRNTGTTTTTGPIACTASAKLKCLGATPSSLTLAPGVAQEIFVTYNALLVGSGTITASSCGASAKGTVIIQ